MCEDKNKKVKSGTDIIRLKKNKVSIALINAVRSITLKRYTGHKKERLCEDKPIDNDFEIYVLLLCSKMLKEYYLGRYKTTIDEDGELLKKRGISTHLKFALIHRLEAKRIILHNIKYLNLLLHIINKATTKDTFKKTYMEQVNSLETASEYNSNRRAIREYLKKYYYYMNK